MENVIENQTQTETVYSNEWIDITIPLTGSNMPEKFKTTIAYMIGRRIAQRLSYDPINKGVTEINDRKLHGEIALELRMKPHGTFENTFILHYYGKEGNMTYFHEEHTFYTDELPNDYVYLYRKKALRKLKKLCKEGLKHLPFYSISAE